MVRVLVCGTILNHDVKTGNVLVNVLACPNNMIICVIRVYIMCETVPQLPAMYGAPI